MLTRLKRNQNKLIALLLFVLLTCLALDNLILHLGTAIPESKDNDYAVFYWNLWWAKHALVDLRTNPLLTNYILYPNTVNLALHTLVLPLGLLSIPFQYLVDLHWIVNGWIVLSFLLSAVLMCLFLRRHAKSASLAMLGAVLFAFSPGIVWRATQTHLNTLSVWWLPLNLLIWDLALERRSFRRALLLGLCVYLTFMTYSESVLWMLLTLAPYTLYGLLTQTTWRARGQVAGLGLAAAAIALVLALVMPLPQLAHLDWNDFPREDLQTVHYFSLPPAALFTRQDVAENNTLGQTLPLLVLVGLALKSQRRERWLWLGAGLLSLLLSFGPYLNDPSLPLPFTLIYHLSRGQYRTPVRLTTPATLALIVFVVLSLPTLLERLRRKWAQPVIIAALIAIVVADSGLLQPFPIRTVPDYPVYHLIGQDPEDHTLLQVPMGPSSGSRGVGVAPELSYYARFHHQRTVNGLVSRVPESQLFRYERSAFLRALALNEPLPSFDAARQEFTQKLGTWDIRYVVIHKDLLAPDDARAFISFFNEQPELCVLDDAPETLAYRAISNWADCPTPELSQVPASGVLDLGEPGDDVYIGRGWYNRENVGGPQARWAGETLTSVLRLVLPPDGLRLRLRALAFPERQVVTVAVNGTSVGTLELATTWSEYTLPIPADARRVQSPSFVTLTHTRLESAFERTGGASQDKRPLAAAYDTFAFERAP